MVRYPLTKAPRNLIYSIKTLKDKVWKILLQRSRKLLLQRSFCLFCWKLAPQ